MAFRETQYPDVLEDENGQMWPLDPGIITQLRNNGQVATLPQSGGGGGGSMTPPGLDPRGRSVQAIPSAASAMSQPMAMDPRGRAAQAVPSAAGGSAPGPIDPRGRSAQAVPSAASPNAMNELISRTMPTGGPPANLQRVAPRQRQQQAPGISPVYQRVGATPEKWVPTQRQTSGISDDQQNELRELSMQTFKTEQEYANAYREQEAARLTENQSRLQLKAFENQRESSRVQSEVDAKNSWIESQQANIRQQLLEARGQKVDPNRVFEGAGGMLSGILSALAIGAGQYSSAINGGPNTALQLINNMIERDVEEQKSAIANKKQDAYDELDYFDRYIARSAEESKDKARLLAEEKAKIEMDYVLNDDALKMLHPAALQTKAAIESQQNERLLRINQAISRTAGERFQPARAGGVIDITDRVLEQQAKRTGLQKQIAENQQAITGGGPADKDAVLVNGEAVGKSPEAKEINAQIRSYQTLKQNAQIAEKMIREGSFLDDARYEALVNDAMFDLAGAKGTTIRSDTDVQQFGDMLGGTSRAKLRKENQIKIWKDAVRRGGNALRNRLGQAGLPSDAIEPDETLMSE